MSIFWFICLPSTLWLSHKNSGKFSHQEFLVDQCRSLSRVSKFSIFVICLFLFVCLFVCLFIYVIIKTIYLTQNPGNIFEPIEIGKDRFQIAARAICPNYI